MRVMRIVCLFVILAAALPVHAQEFRVDNEVFKEGQKAPFMRSLTLFKDEGDLVYDFAFAGAGNDVIEQATLYDFARNRFLVVDYLENVKVLISQEELLKFMAELAKLEEKDPLFKEASNPAFTVTREDGVLKFAGSRIRYEVKYFDPKNRSAATHYQRFADWSARLTTLQIAQPPMARIFVNKELAKAGLMPKEVTLLRTAGPVWENVNKFYSKHIVDWQLTKTDGKRIEALDARMAEMETISWVQYRGKLAEKSKGSTRR
jgi:hypothetical protein